MKKEIISTTGAPATIGPYSQAVSAGEFIFASGQIPIDPVSGTMSESITEQAHQSLKNLRAILEAAGSSMAGVVKTTVFISDIKNFGEVNGVYAQYFTENFPARSCFEVGALPKGALIEVEAVAVKS